MERDLRTAADALTEAEESQGFSTGIEEIDRLVGGIAPRGFYLFYGSEKEPLDLLVHSLLVSAVGLGAKAVYLNFCDYYHRKTLLDPNLLSGLAKTRDVKPADVLDQVHGVFAFNENQLLPAVEEAVEAAEGEDARLLVVHDLTRFLETSEAPRRAGEEVRKGVGRLKTAVSELGLTVAATGAARGGGEVPEPMGGSVLVHGSTATVYMQQVGGGLLRTRLVKHPSRRVPQGKLVRFGSSFGGADLTGRVTPSFRQLFLEEVERLKKKFQEALLEEEHREGFDHLLREAWQPESHAMQNASIPHTLDVMNLMADVHLAGEVERLRRRVEELEERLDTT